MDFEREKKKLQARLDAAKQRLQKEDAKRKALKRQLLATTARLNDRAEKWHRFSLAHDDRVIGYTGEHAIARAYLRAMPSDKYFELVRKQSNDGNSSLIAAEFATVVKHFNRLTELGREVLLKRDGAVYEKDLAEWQAWARDNPDQNDWRSRTPSKGQIMLIERIAEYRAVDLPSTLNRGEAHDWIEQHGGNPRFSPNVPDANPEGDA